MIKISVTDDGIGIEKANNESILNHYGSKYGLKNVDQRIKLYFGDDYGVRLYIEGTTR